MGQEQSVICPVCKCKKATYKDIFEAEGKWPRKMNFPFAMEIFKNIINNSYIEEEEFRLPPFENFLGPDCLKYIYDQNPDYKVKENISYWLFYSCDDCIDIGCHNRREKFYEYNPNGVTIWRSQLP